ncbi:ribosomal-protein-alanine N-acetyltransferase [Bacillus mesophilus]|uniref:GNAT family N-acetyltransferase n=1 Tax=Bacillus mesophilus TaxID=1808955 RepID=A0A6M0Q8K3_9BACI|nr:GNAT family N-acetyltransferase [Bacillus mesophilus]MBM7661396.1 ribosomal-protein-alanine N-acetyltransferase [Bacillus mesophilus]NEY72069.1 GNAT family N-acetyltransferase [Bacillus mesophilus]
MSKTLKKQEWFTAPPEIVTENYYIRGLSITDADRLFPILSDKETMKFITPHPVQTVADVKVNIQDNLRNFSLQKEIPWVIIHKESHELIGMFRFHKLNMWHQKTEMGVVIGKSHQHKGVMSEMLKHLLQFGFVTLGLNRIVGDIFAGNRGSEQLLLKYGFHKDGQIRQTDFDGEQFHDTVVYSLLKNEYLKEGH